MRPGRDALARAVDAVVEGTGGLDWGSMTVELHDERDRELLRHIRLLSQIADVQRTQSGVEDDAALRVKARAIASVLPFGEPARERGGEASTVSQDVAVAGDVPRWGRVELLELVGKGTFGDVYRAHDGQLQREVAVKLLHAGTRLVDRMLNEARALARVQHPNVVVVYDAEERDGRAGLCMEFIRGRTLARILADQGARGAREAALVGQDLCQALAAVHAAGLVHRDIKAQNVMREDGGRVVLMDFGAGLSLDDGRTRPGSVTGTPLYLAPEVLDHGEASVRSDIYSLGVLLYHLVTNDYPIRGQTPEELIEARRQGRVRRLRDVAPKLPSWFVTAVERAIAPDPQDRFATVGEFEAALSVRTPTRIWPLLLAAVLTLATAAGVQQLWSHRPGNGVSLPRLAVLPLDAGLGVDGPVAAAVTDEIYQGLAMVDTLRVISPFSAAKSKRDQSTMPQIAKVLEASAVIDGTVSETDGQFEVKLRVFDAGSDSPRWAGMLTASRSSLGALRRDSVMSIARALNIDVSARVLKLLGRPAGATSQAYDAYAIGRDFQARAGRTDHERARAEFERAIAFDPLFAPSHVALARAYLDLGTNGPRSEWAAQAARARVAALRAIELDPGSAEAHASLAQVAFLFDWDWKRAEGAYRQAIALNPSNDFARQRYAQFLAAQGKVSQGFDELDVVRGLNPFSDTTDVVRVALLQYDRRFQEAESLGLAILGRAPNSRAVHTQLGRIYSATGRFDKAIEEFKKIEDPAAGDSYVAAEIASAEAGAGRVQNAQTILERLTERSATEEISPELFSLVHARLGNADEAFRYLDLAFRNKASRMLWIKVDPRWDPLRSDPRFNELVRRIGL